MKYGLRRFRNALLQWFEAEARDLPWRRTRDPYRVYLAEIILQQTRVAQGLPYYERFLERFPTLKDLAAADEQDVLKQWEGLGYYTRARNMHKAAGILMEQYAGCFPDNPESLVLLPGIGRYTAGAIASIAFNKPVPLVDGNVKRVLARLYAIDDPIDLHPTEQLLWERAATMIPADKPGNFNQAMMELGARICTPKAPQCEICPVQRHCCAKTQKRQDVLPVRLPKKDIPHHQVAIAAIYSNGRYLIGKRPSKGLLGGLWEFPGGKMRQGEHIQDTLMRESGEELGVVLDVGGLIAVAKHAYTHFKVTLHVYRCTIVSGTPAPNYHTELRWVAPEEFGAFPFPKGNHKFLHLL